MFVLDGRGRIGSSSEPNVPPAPLFALIRGASSCAWAVRGDVPETVAAEVERLAREEHPLERPLEDLQDPHAAPTNADVYLALLGGQINSGPAFTFPDRIAHHSNDVAPVDKLELLERNGRGFAPRVTSAWAAAIRSSGRIPLYSTSWTNSASRAVARKLGLVQYAVDWTIIEPLKK